MLCCTQPPDEFADSYTLSGCRELYRGVPDELCGVYTRVPAHCIHVVPGTSQPRPGTGSCPGGLSAGDNADPTLCGGVPAYQSGGVDGFVLLLTGNSPANMQWFVGDPESLARCTAVRGQRQDIGRYPMSNRASEDSSNPGYAPPTAYSRWYANVVNIRVVAGGGR